MKYDQKALYAELTHFYLSICEKEQLDEPRLRGLVGSLVRKARQAIPEEWDDKAKIHQLLQLFYGDWGFHCDADNYFYARNLYLPYILEEREGMPVSLGALILYLAASLKLPIYPVNFPTQLILRAEVEGEVAFIDPWSGKYISVDELKKLYEGAFGFGAQIQPEDLARADIQFLLAGRKDPYDIRDRGLVLAQMGAYPSAIEDLEYFVDQCPNDPTSSLLKTQLLELKGEALKDAKSIH